MTKYIFIRLGMVLFVLFGVLLLLFALLYTVPGDPARMMLGVTASEADVQALRDSMGLNDPFFVQFGRYLVNLVTKGDIGTSYQTRLPVIQEVASRLPISLLLAFLSITISLVVGVSTGIVSAIRQYSWMDKICSVIGVIGVSMPSFWLGLQLSLVFSLNLRWFPPTGFSGPREWVLPAVTLGFAGAASFMRYTRSSVLDVVRMDYLRTARSKGQSEFVVVMHHVLKNALIPIVTNIGSQLSGMLGGALVVEMVFSIPGMGAYMIGGIKTRDYPVVLGGVLVLSAVSCVIVLVVDIAYAFIDPRIRSKYRR
jgi:peptide/nickel transport system permease protein